MQGMWVRLAILWVFLAGPVVAGLLLSANSAWGAMLAYHLGCGIAAVGSGAGLGRRPGGRRLAAFGLFSAALTGSALAIAWRALPERAGDVWQDWGLVPPGDRFLLIWYVGVNPWVEEWFWRGALLGPRVRERLGRAGSRAFAVLGFLPLHVVVLVASFGTGMGTLFAFCVLLGSAGWTALRERTGCVWWSAASHEGADLGIALAYWIWLRPAWG